MTTIAPTVLEWAFKAVLTYTITEGSVNLYVKGDFTGKNPKTSQESATHSVFRDNMMLPRGLVEVPENRS